MNEKKLILEYARDSITIKIHDKNVLVLSFLKACILKETGKKRRMLQKSEVSYKLNISYPKQCSNVRFFSEIYIANSERNYFALIKNIIFNSKHPGTAVATIFRDNVYKDFRVNFQLYNIINTNSSFTLQDLQKQRLNYLLINNSTHSSYEKHINNVQEIIKMFRDPILINVLVQKEFLHYSVLNVLQKLFSYVINFFLILLFIRYLRWGNVLDLKVLYNNIHNCYIKYLKYFAIFYFFYIK